MFLHFLVDPAHKKAFLELASRVAASDGFVNLNEKNYILGWKQELGMGVWEPDSESADTPLAELLRGVKEEAVKNVFLAEIVLLTYADGNFDEEEQRIVCEMKQSFGYSDEAFEAFKDWAIRYGQLKVEGMNLILRTSAR
ncbi:TerB family tellurite resistance protein [Cohnella suwonensis]|uniref:TerB family tellurite resistance protein n=1 Tax=Cohnella suwonensis TaxID=696072 RepID=A0ABW0LU29_9BACL